MDHTTLIVIFLAFTSVTVITNSLLILFAYKGFSAVTMKVTEAVREFETSTSTREWIASLEKAAAQSIVVTETTKHRMAEYGPVLDHMQVRYSFMLAKLDTNVERFADSASETAIRVRDAVANPALKMDMVTAALHKAVTFISSVDATPRP